MSADLDRQIDDLIAAAELDADDADDLRAAMAEVKARKDAKLRGEVQRTVGSTHLTLREGMDRIIGLQVDTRGLVTDAIKQLEAQGAVLDAARAEFHTQLNAVGESVSQLSTDLAVVSNDVADLKHAAISQDNFNRQMTERLDRIEGRQRRDGQVLQQHDQRIAAVEDYAASVPPEERQRVITAVEAIERRYLDMQREREADRIWREEVIEQLADVLARLPEKDEAQRAGR